MRQSDALRPQKDLRSHSTRTWEQLGNNARRTRGNTRIRADQKARRDNHLGIADPVCKTCIPASASREIADCTVALTL
jgi:hypothetical protein